LVFGPIASWVFEAYCAQADVLQFVLKTARKMRVREDLMVAAAIALAFKAIYWGFLVTVTAVFIACFVRSVLAEEAHHKKRWLRLLQR